MTYGQILFEVQDRVAWITLNRPARLNAWTLRMGAEVRHAMVTADRDPEVRAIVVTGAGRAYCAGADMDLLVDLQSGQRSTTPDDGLSDLTVELDPALPDFLRGEYGYPLGLGTPVIAAFNGVAAGLGVSYPLHYDLRLASETARLSLLFSRRGLIAEHASAWMLTRLVGPGLARELLFTGRFVDATEAARIGLVNRVIPETGFRDAVAAVARDIAELASPRSVRIMKRQLFDVLHQDLATAAADSDQRMVECFETDDFREGVTSFLERRPPRFRGR